MKLKTRNSKPGFEFLLHAPFFDNLHTSLEPGSLTSAISYTFDRLVAYYQDKGVSTESIMAVAKIKDYTPWKRLSYLILAKKS